MRAARTDSAGTDLVADLADGLGHGLGRGFGRRTWPRTTGDATARCRRQEAPTARLRRGPRPASQGRASGPPGAHGPGVSPQRRTQHATRQRNRTQQNDATQQRNNATQQRNAREQCPMSNVRPAAPRRIRTGPRPTPANQNRRTDARAGLSRYTGRAGRAGLGRRASFAPRFRQRPAALSPRQPRPAQARLRGFSRRSDRHSAAPPPRCARPCRDCS